MPVAKGLPADLAKARGLHGARVAAAHIHARALIKASSADIGQNGSAHDAAVDLVRRKVLAAVLALLPVCRASAHFFLAVGR